MREDAERGNCSSVTEGPWNEKRLAENYEKSWKAAEAC
jgi:hypothetical protein